MNSTAEKPQSSLQFDNDSSSDCSVVDSKNRKVKRKRRYSCRPFPQRISISSDLDLTQEISKLSSASKLRLTPTAVEALNALLVSVLNRLENGAREICTLRGKITLTVEEMQVAARLILPGRFSSLGDQNAQKMCLQYEQTTRKCSKNKSKISSSKQPLASSAVSRDDDSEISDSFVEDSSDSEMNCCQSEGPNKKDHYCNESSSENSDRLFIDLEASDASNDSHTYKKSIKRKQEYLNKISTLLREMQTNAKMDSTTQMNRSVDDNGSTLESYNKREGSNSATLMTGINEQNEEKVLRFLRNDKNTTDLHMERKQTGDKNLKIN